MARDIKERDWVVTGASEAEMLAAGFKQVGQQFPVFLHPITGEEYALARREVKTGFGHKGFAVTIAKEITLEQDLARRDLTINAIAMDSEGHVIDPFQGRNDIEQKVIRHVGDAFSEDPLRCFRVARFASRFPGFTIATSTLQLMTSMADELTHLPAERVWVEYKKSMSESTPARFYEVLLQTGIQDPWFTSLNLNTLVELHARLDLKGLNAFAGVAWTHSLEQSNDVFQRLKSPKRIQTLVKNVAKHGTTLAQWRITPPQVVLDALTACKAFLSGPQFEDTFTGVETCAQVELKALRSLIQRIYRFQIPPNRKGHEIGRAVAQQRVTEIRLAQENATKII